MSLPNNTPIFEEGEYCAVCGAVEDLGLFDDEIAVCQTCYSGGQFRDWLAVEMEKALAVNPNFERTPEGGYRRKAAVS